MEDKKEIESILHNNELDPQIITEEDLKFIHGGAYSVSDTQSEAEGPDSSHVSAISTPSVKEPVMHENKQIYAEDLGSLQLEQLKLEKKNVELDLAN